VRVRGGAGIAARVMCVMPGFALQRAQGFDLGQALAPGKVFEVDVQQA